MNVADLGHQLVNP